MEEEEYNILALWKKRCVYVRTNPERFDPSIGCQQHVGRKTEGTVGGKRRKQWRVSVGEAGSRPYYMVPLRVSRQDGASTRSLDSLEIAA
jgi:hypothetical protein